MSATGSPAPPPAIARKRLSRRLRWAIPIVVIVIAVSTTSAFVLLSPPPLTIAPGYQVGRIEGNLTAFAITDPSFGSFSATTFANQSAGPTSTLVLQLNWYAYYTPYPDGGPGWFQIHLNISVAANLASNIRPGSLGLRYNKTANASVLDPQLSWWGGENVSLREDAGSSTLTATPAGPTSTDPTYEFRMWERFDVTSFRHYDGYYGFQATLTGFLLRPISVGILLAVTNIP